MLSAQQLATMSGGKTTGQWQACGVTTDTRTLSSQSFYVALVGPNFNGHDFVKEALAKGAAGALVSQYVPDAPEEKQIVVPDTLKAMADIGSTLRKKFSGQVVGLTGSAGKTTTREGLKSVLSHFGNTYATEKNFNNHIGVPITLCNMPEAGDYAVFEMAMDKSGEIAHLTNMIQPNIALITNIYPMHIENFANLEGIAHAKAEIFEGLPKSGTAIFNADANHADILRQKAEALGIKNILTFGESGNIRLAEHTQSRDQSIVSADVAGISVTFTLSTPGTHRIYNALAILAVVCALGLDPQEAAPHLDNIGALPGRGKTTRLPLPNGGHFTLIDESYSGQPEAMRLALENMQHIPLKNKGRRIAVLGQMAELGTHSEAEHTSVGHAAAEARLDLVIGIGEHVRPLLKATQKTTETQFRPNIHGLTDELTSNILQDGDVLLIKGSRYSSRVFEVADALLALKGEASPHVTAV